VPCNPNIAD
jgi:hypothetical protein